jgi:DNA-directed RNA polymerase specialized sigma24 family protein
MAESHGLHAPFESDEHYLQLRLKLIFYFERRRCSCPEDLADDCLSRVLLYTRRRGQPTSLERLVFGFAPKVYFEFLRASSRVTTSADDLPDGALQCPPAEESRLLAEISVGRLDPADRELMEQYYIDRRTAGSLAAEWGLSPEGVRSRVFRKKRGLLKFFFGERPSPGNESGASKHK